MDTDDRIERYRAAVLACALACRLLQQHDLPQLLRDIDHAEAVGPIIDPTLWRQKHQAMEEDRQLLQAAIALRNALPMEGSNG